MTFKKGAVRGVAVARKYLQGALWAAVTRHTGERPHVVCAAGCNLSTRARWAPLFSGHPRSSPGILSWGSPVCRWEEIDFHCTSFWSGWLIFTTFCHFLMQKKKSEGEGSSMEKCQRDLSIPFSDKHPQIQAAGELGTSAEGAECPDWSVDAGLL